VNGGVKIAVPRRSRIQLLSFPRASIITTFILHSHDTIHMPDTQDQYTRATELAKEGLLDEALAIFQALLKTDSNNATIWNNIGIIRFRQGDYREAVNAFGQATDVDPEFTNAWFNKGLALVNLEKETEALRALDKVLKLNPRDKEAQSQRALIVRKMAQISDAGRTDSQSVQSQLRV
jgi:tetratricopeptide (TPR) repeat protein